MSEPRCPLVVIGVGNTLLSDDGVGMHVIEGLRRLQVRDPAALPAETRLVDGGTLLLDLLHAVRDGRGLVLVDAVRLGGPAGSVHVLRDGAIVERDDASAPAGNGSGPAPNSVGELLAVARLMGWLPARVSLVGVEVDRTEFGTDLSTRIAAAVPHAIETVCAELHAMDTQVIARELAGAIPTQSTGAQP